jgi:two-component system NtrC family sensor kinase
VFLAGRDPDEPAFDLADEELFGILARQADIALENARLYGELRAYVKQVEESQLALIQAEKMAAVGRLTASIAHEVNNPLQALQNSLHLAGRAVLSVEEREDYLKMAEEELQRLMLTVERMLNFYRPGALNREPTDVGVLLQTVLKLLKKQLDEQGVVVHNQVEAGLSNVVVVTNQLQQVFFNLILNALEVMPEGGELTIASKVHKSQLEITFQDSGPGIAVEQRAHIFEPFVTTRENGTGLGLSVSYGILTAHGGSLDLVEGSGRGACFRVRLPLEEDETKFRTES